MSDLEHKLRIFGMAILNTKWKDCKSRKTCVQKILRTRNYCRNFIKNLLPEKRIENMWTKQPRFTSRLNNYRSASIFTFNVKNIWKNHDRVTFPVFLKHTFKVLDRFQKNLSVQQCLVSIIGKSKHAVDNSKASKALLFHLLKACGRICPELLTDFMSQVFFYTSWKYQKTSGFLIFSGVIERYQ